MDEDRVAAGKKNAGRKGTIVFVDETGFSEAPSIRRTWAPRGQTPVLRPRFRSWRRMSAIGGLAYRMDNSPTRILLKFHRGSIRTPQVLTFLKHLRRHLPGKVIVIWDGLQAHRAKAVTGWVESTAKFEVVRLPPYAPDLNAIEGLWAWVKNWRLANVCEDTLDPVIDRVRRGIRTARGCERRLRGLLKKTGLSI